MLPGQFGGALTTGLIASAFLAAGGFLLLLRKSNAPGQILAKTGFSIPFIIFCLSLHKLLGWGSPYMIGVVGLAAIVLTLLWVPHIGEWVSSPLTGLYDGGGESGERKPLYSMANSKRKRGQYRDAIAEVRRQLAKFPGDFEGVMLLASIQAENMQDMPGAELTLENFCAKQHKADSRIIAAWMQLADWHLKLAFDANAARVILQKVIDRFPGTEASLKAEQRMAHLAETEQRLLAQYDRQRVVVPEGVHNLGLRDSMTLQQPEETDPAKLAAEHVKQLESHPHDSEAREKLAVIYAKDFKRLDLASMELAVLINESRHSDRQIARWLNLLANFQLELGADIKTVRGTLQEIVDRFPDLSLAQVTQRRLVRLESEFRGKTETPVIKLGTYEQNIGLKYGAPPKA